MRTIWAMPAILAVVVTLGCKDSISFGGQNGTSAPAAPARAPTSAAPATSSTPNTLQPSNQAPATSGVGTNASDTGSSSPNAQGTAGSGCSCGASFAYQNNDLTHVQVIAADGSGGGVIDCHNALSANNQIDNNLLCACVCNGGESSTVDGSAGGGTTGGSSGSSQSGVSTPNPAN
jgi:hypothetical protein